MPSVKSPLLRSLLKNLNKAVFAEKHPYIDTDTLLDLERTDAYSRRKFLLDATKTVGAIGLASLLPLNACNSDTPNKDAANKAKTAADSIGTQQPSKNQPSVAIVGGGIAGLHAAYILQKSGIVAQVYEADKRLGGRINTQSDIFGKGLTTEFGGEFVDSNHEDMLSLAKEFGLELLDTEKDITDNKLIKDAYFFNNQHYSEKEVINEFRKIVKTLKRDKAKCGEDFDTPYAEALDKISVEKYARSLPCAKWLQDHIIMAYIAEYGLDGTEQSALNFVDMIDTDTSDGLKIYGDSDERYKIKGGNHKVIEALQAKLPNQINTGQVLTAIRSANNKTTLVFDGGKEVSADFVILAIPFTILRAIDMKIEGMSPEKLACIKELGYGQNNKLFLGFRSHVWRGLQPAYAGYLFHPDIHNGWDHTQGQNNNEGAAGYTIFLGGQPSIAMAAAAAAQNLKDSAPDAMVQDYLTKLDTAFVGVKRQFNGTHKAALWSNNPFVKASYACYKPGQWTTISGQEFEPVGTVHFAGEHCSEDFQGYMNGGAETGRRAAENILAALKAQK